MRKTEREMGRMNQHNLFYYPYASLTDAQLPLLKVAALYFDKFYILDPVGASWNVVGAEYHARKAVRLLAEAGILKVINPATVLATYEKQIAEAVRQDMHAPDFQSLCDTHIKETGKQRWTLALSKVPKDLQTDQVMRHLMGNFARDVSAKTAYATNDYIEDIEALSALPGNHQPVPQSTMTRAQQYSEYAETGQIYDEYYEGYSGETIEYRYADYPLALGEAIMINHALFAGLLQAEATPVTDNAFHSRALSLKLEHAAENPAVQDVVNNRAKARRLKASQLAVSTLTDIQLNLPVLNPELPFDEILDYRQNNDDALRQARDKLGWMARHVEAEPWSEAFAEELEHETIPDIAKELDEARKARDAWLKGKRGRLALGAAGVAAGAAGVVLSVFTAPLTPIALAGAGLSLASGAAIPGATWLLDWREGKNTTRENGLHYLLRL